MKVLAWVPLLWLGLTACSDMPRRPGESLLADPVCVGYQLGGKVTNNAGASAYVVLDDGGRQLTVKGSGAFTFPDVHCAGIPYRVHVVAQTAGTNCVVQNNTGVFSAAPINNIAVTCGTTTSSTYTFTPGTAGNYTYNAGPATPSTAINYGGGEMALPSTAQLDNSAATFNLGTYANTTFDAGTGMVRLSMVAAGGPLAVHYGGEPSESYAAAFINVADAVLGASNVGGLCCGLTAMEGSSSVTDAGSYPVGGDHIFLASGSGNGSSPTYSNNIVMKITSPKILMNSHSYLDYYIWPFSNGAMNSVTDPLSLYLTLNVIFSDGSDAISGGATDQHGRSLDPMSQYASLTADGWNHVHVDLSAFAGKQVDRVDVNFHNDGANGGFRADFDEIVLVGQADNLPTNTATFDAGWTPQYNQLAGYWHFDGPPGNLAQGTVLNSEVGAATLVAHNADGWGLTYVDGQLGQGILLDGVDDWLQLPNDFLATNTAYTFSGWYNETSNPYDCAAVFAFIYGTDHFYTLTPTCYGSSYLSPHKDNGDSPDLVMQTMPTNTWTHVVATQSGSTASVYLNGMLWGTSNAVNYTPADIPGILRTLGLNSNPSYTRGRFDEIAFWNVALQPNEILLIYERQRSAVSGSFISRVFDATTTAPWTGLAWTTPEPFGKSLPNGTSETAAGYPAVSPGLESQLVLLWHFDETALGTAPGGADVLDSSGAGNHGLYFGVLNTDFELGNPGIVHDTNGVRLHCTGVDVGYVATTNTFAAGLANFSYQVWFKNNPLYGGGRIIGFGDQQATYSNNYDRHVYLTDEGQVYYGIFDGSVELIETTVAYNDGRWHHAVVTQNGALGTFYMDGAAVGTVSGTPSPYTMYLRVGKDAMGSWPDQHIWEFRGMVDEVAMWTRSLLPAEVLQLYRRGANRMGFQARVCTQPDCSDNPLWKGPDGTAAMMFSEVENTTGTTILTTSPNMLFTAYSNAGAVASSQYFQYRTWFDSDDRNNLCTYGATPLGCTAELSTVSIAPVHYSTVGPTFTASSPLPSFSYITQITDAYGATGCAGRLGYRFSLDGSAWYFYTNGKWQSASPTMGQLNLAADLTPAILSQFSTDVGHGSLHLQGVLRSDGAHACSLSSITITYLP